MPDDLKKSKPADDWTEIFDLRIFLSAKMHENNAIFFRRIGF